MFERFTETARRVISGAHEEAQQRGHRAVNPEHLFRAMLRQREGIALAVLERLGLQRGVVTEDLEGMLASVGAATEPVTEIPFGIDALQALERTIQQARYLESNWVGTEHLLLGLLQDRHSPVTRTLGAHGIQFESALAMVLTLLGKPIGPAPKRPSPDD
jgi:ATP-dependent Clp protease ATP-binding subunit ClpC